MPSTPIQITNVQPKAKPYKLTDGAGLHLALNHFFKRLDFGIDDFASHGLRATGATLLREHGFGRDVVELLLAHKERNNSTTAAYHHHELPDERRRALQYLADRIDHLAEVCSRQLPDAATSVPTEAANC